MKKSRFTASSYLCDTVMGQVQGSQVRGKGQIACVDGAQLVEGQVHQQHGQLTEGRAQVSHFRDAKIEGRHVSMYV